MKERVGGSMLTPISVVCIVAFLFCINNSAYAQLPRWPGTYRMNQSTIVMYCNDAGLTDPSVLKGWGYIDVDWSNAKQIWAKSKPMDCTELLIKQVTMFDNAGPYTTGWVYRNSIKALPWYSMVREKLTNPQYAPWFLKFAPGRTYHVPQCDSNYNPPLCTNLYHDQEQTPEYPSGDGNCAAPACDVGSVPVGEYLWDPRAWNVSINGETLGEWFINKYVFDATGGANPKVSGFFFDDFWTTGGPTEMEPHAPEDMGLSAGDLQAINNAYWSNMNQVYATVLQRGKFSWQQFMTTNPVGILGATCPGPFVHPNTCANDLRQFCTANNPAQNRFMMYAFSPGVCAMNPANLVYFGQDLANFLLVRGPYAVLGHGWLGCGNSYPYPDALNWDFGIPLANCQEVGSGIFQRRYSKAVVTMNCNNWTESITLTEEVKE